MNVLKSALRLSKNQSSTALIKTLYEQVKLWDEARARILQNHLRAIQLGMDALDLKVSEVDKYIDGLDKLMSARIEQITSYCKNGVNDSQFFLVPSSLNSLKPCHQLLKHLLMEQSQRQQNLSDKGSALTIILEKLKKMKTGNINQSQNWGSSVTEIKSNIRFLIDCELPDLNEEVQASCKAVSAAFHEQKNFYLSVDRFVCMADKQLQKHRAIGKEFLVLVENFTKREKELRSQLRQLLVEWVKQDLEDKIFQQQLCKNPAEQLINEYYDIQNLIPEHSQLWKDQSLALYLQNLQILPFREHQRLVVYARQVFYNTQVEAKVVLTIQKEAYLFRIISNEPDFSFLLNKNIRIKQKAPLLVEVSQVHKTLLLREETDFGFTLEFNLEADLKEFQEKCKQLGCIFQNKTDK